MNVLVAGSAGFIGTRLFHNYPSNKWGGCDLKTEAYFEAVELYNIDVIVLLAADLTQTKEGYINNLNIYNHLAGFDGHVIFTSSAAVYEDSNTAHLEGEKPNPSTIYGRSKLLGEEIIKETVENYTIFRLSNVYGDGDGNGAVDLFKNGHNIIYGYGQDIRDYIHVNKVTSAIYTVIENQSKYNGMTFNISSGSGISTNDAYEQYGKGKPIYKDAREFDVKHSVLDNRLAQEMGLL